MFHIVLHQPQIAPNTGNIIRIAANTGCKLHLIEPLGFDFEEKKLRRAGLDYHDMTVVKRYPNYQAFIDSISEQLNLAPSELRIFACTTKGSRHYHTVNYQKNDIFLFGSESNGLPDHIRDAFAPEFRIRIPMMPDSRSINIANSVSIICYEAWRQYDFEFGL